MEASRAEFDSPDVREGKGPSALFDRPLLKYVGFALLLAARMALRALVRAELLLPHPAA